TRLGQPKQLLPFRGKTLLRHILDEAEGLVFSSRVLVLGAYAEEIRTATTPGLWTVVVNEDWAVGMGGSLRLGVAQSLQQNPATEHLLFLLSDQPFVSEDFLNVLIQKHIKNQSPITASEYQGIMGVPALFSQAYFAELMALSGDQGARKLFKAYETQVLRVPFEGGAFDIDTPADVERLREVQDSHHSE
ncbi:MAG: nucleotidyltransferase family protein, partial [Bacteroidetes bacterium]